MTKLVTEEMMLEADGKRLGGDSEYWIYLTNLRAYNEGVLLGVYLHFPFDVEDINAAYKTIFVDNEFVDHNGCSYEEYFITDYDAPFEVSEDSYPLVLAEKYDSLTEYMNYPHEVIKVISNHLGAEVSFFELDNDLTASDEEKLGYALVEADLIVVPDHLRNYLDYEAIGRDYALNSSGEFAANYYIEFS